MFISIFRHAIFKKNARMEMKISNTIQIELARLLIFSSVFLCILSFTICALYFHKKESEVQSFGCGVAEPFYCGNVYDNQKYDTPFQDGKLLFEQNCKTCHSIHNKKVGPALTGISKRRNFKWIAKFIRNSEKMIIKDKDKYAVALFKEYNGTSMTNFPSLTDKEIRSIINYIEQ